MLLLTIAIYVALGFMGGVLCLLVRLGSAPWAAFTRTEIWAVTCPETKTTAAVAVSRRSRLAAVVLGSRLHVRECSLRPFPLTCGGSCFTSSQSTAATCQRHG